MLSAPPSPAIKTVLKWSVVFVVEFGPMVGSSRLAEHNARKPVGGAW